VPDCDEAGRYWCGICALSNCSGACNSVKSRVVEYLENSRQKHQTKHGVANGWEDLPEMGYFEALKRIQSAAMSITDVLNNHFYHGLPHAVPGPFQFYNQIFPLWRDIWL